MRAGLIPATATDKLGAVGYELGGCLQAQARLWPGSAQAVAVAPPGPAGTGITG